MIPHSILVTRRQNLAVHMVPNSILVLFSAETIYRNSDVEFPFRQDSNFWYHTGLDEPKSIFVLRKNRNGQIEEWLYVQKREKEKEIWTGIRAGTEGAKEITGIDQVKTWDEFENGFSTLVKDCVLCYFDTDGNSLKELRRRLTSTIEDGSIKLVASAVLMRGLRIYKDAWEIEQMRKAADISVCAHKKAVQLMWERIKNGEEVWEYQLEADLYREFRYRNAGWAYPAIVARGSNACTLHYVKNNEVLKSGDLVLVDAGAEYNYYAADITRCYPVSGKFSPAQRAIYEIVLAAQLAGIEEIGKVDATNVSVHQKVVVVLTAGLIDLGILIGTLAENIELRKYFKYFMHGTGHFLGLDVHDIGGMRDENNKSIAIKLEPGMVMTVEPGLYFDPGDFSIPEEFRGIGIRIEDDVLRTAEGVEVLTAGLAKTVQEVETLIKN